MAYRLIRCCSALIPLKRPAGCLITGIANSIVQKNSIVNKQSDVLINIVRHTSFFNKYPAEDIWKGVTSVSNAGKRRGRGRSRRPIRNLNRGQMIGVGKINIVWPGLNAPVIRGRELVQQKRLEENPEREKKIYKLRDTSQRKTRTRVHPLERGWTSAKPGGRKIGPPDPIGDEKFEGFETIILEYKQVVVMTGNMGRKRRISAMVATGNRNGLVGFGLGKSPDGRVALRKAKNRAAQRLMYIERYNEHTIYHDFWCQFAQTRLFCFQRNEGQGLTCHRIVKAICELIGIKDISCRLEMSANPQNIVKAFFLGLLKQKTHEQMAQEKGLHLVEFRKERDSFPVVIASPTVCRKENEIKPNEILDFHLYGMEGKVHNIKPRPPPFYEKLPSWKYRLSKVAYLRNKEDVRVQVLGEHGEYRSFLTDKYPEAKPKPYFPKKKKEVEF